MDLSCIPRDMVATPRVAVYDYETIRKITDILTATYNGEAVFYHPTIIKTVIFLFSPSIITKLFLLG